MKILYEKTLKKIVSQVNYFTIFGGYYFVVVVVIRKCVTGNINIFNEGEATVLLVEWT